MASQAARQPSLAYLSLTDGFCARSCGTPPRPRGLVAEVVQRCAGKKGNRRHTTLSLLNADAKALCLRPDPELVKVFGIPQRHRSVESCPSAGPKDAPVA